MNIPAMTDAMRLPGSPTTLMQVRVFGSGCPGAGSMSVLMQFDVGHSRTAATNADSTPARHAATFLIV